MVEPLAKLLEDPLVALVCGYGGLFIYWSLRVHGWSRPSYDQLADRIGHPMRVEKWALGLVLALGAVLIVYRFATEILFES